MNHNFKVINQIEEVCFCSRHQGDVLRQADIELPGHRLVRVMSDKYGYYYKFGDKDSLGGFGWCPEPINKEEFEKVIMEAIRG